MTRRHPPPRSGPPLPGVWLFSDERLAALVERLAARLPPGSGIVLRHDSLTPGARWRLARRLMRIARSRGLTVLLAAPPATARRWGVDGVHLRHGVENQNLSKTVRAELVEAPFFLQHRQKKEQPFDKLRANGKNMMHRARQARKLNLRLSMPVHDGREARRARRAGADIVFVSPLHATRSHPGAPALGRKAWLRLARLAAARPVALGGMTPPRARMLRRAATGSGIKPGWAAIDAWDQAAAPRGKRQKRKAVPT